MAEVVVPYLIRPDQIRINPRIKDVLSKKNVRPEEYLFMWNGHIIPLCEEDTLLLTDPAHLSDAESTVSEIVKLKKGRRQDPNFSNWQAQVIESTGGKIVHGKMGIWSRLSHLAVVPELLGREMVDPFFGRMLFIYNQKIGGGPVTAENLERLANDFNYHVILRGATPDNAGQIGDIFNRFFNGSINSIDLALYCRHQAEAANEG